MDRRSHSYRQVLLQYVPAPTTSCPQPAPHGLGSGLAPSLTLGPHLDLARLARADLPAPVLDE